MKTSELLAAAKAVIENPENWIRHRLAADGQRGVTVPPESFRARCFCSLGALHRAAVTQGADRSTAQFNKAGDYLDEAAHDQGLPSLVMLNDRGPGHDAVMQMFASAIEAAQAAGN